MATYFNNVLTDTMLKEYGGCGPGYKWFLDTWGKDGTPTFREVYDHPEYKDEYGDWMYENFVNKEYIKETPDAINIKIRKIQDEGINKTVEARFFKSYNLKTQDYDTKAEIMMKFVRESIKLTKTFIFPATATMQDIMEKLQKEAGKIAL